MAKKKDAAAETTAVLAAPPVRVWEVTCRGSGFAMPALICEAETEEVAREKYRVKYSIRRTDLVIDCKPLG